MQRANQLCFARRVEWGCRAIVVSFLMLSLGGCPLGGDDSAPKDSGVSERAERDAGPNDASKTSVDSGSGYMRERDSGQGGSHTNEPAIYTLGGIVTGVCGAIKLRGSGTEELLVERSGRFTFATKQPYGAPYKVSVAEQPDDVRCQIVFPGGFDGDGIVHGNIDNIRIACLGPSVTLGGEASGVAPQTLAIGLAGSVDSPLVLQSDSSFKLADKVVCGESYAATIITPPQDRVCIVRNGLGVASRTPPAMRVDCFEPDSDRRAPQRLARTKAGGFQFVTAGGTSPFRYEQRTSTLGLDTSVLQDGYTDFGAGNAYELGAADFKVFPDGAVLAVGDMDGKSNCPEVTQYDLTLVKWNSTGVLDPSFGGGDGIVQHNYLGVCTDWMYDDSPATLGVQSTGRIVVGERIHDGTPYEKAVLIAFTSQGALDTSFGVEGKLVVSPPEHPVYRSDVYGVYRLAVASDDSLWVVACREKCGTVLHYTAAGALDTSIAPFEPVAGEGEAVSSGHYDFVALALDDRGRVWLGGNRLSYNDEGPVETAVLLRLTAAGKLDTTFGKGGIVALDLPLQLDKPAGVASIAFKAGGKVVVGGAYQLGFVEEGYEPGVAFLLQLEDDGSIDSAFGAGGLITSHPNGAEPFSELNYGNSALLISGSDVFAARGFYDNGKQVLHIERF